MKRMDRNGEAVESINTLKFEGRRLLAKLNDIESGAAQWSKKTIVSPDDKPIWYHAEKARYLERTNHTLES